MPVVRRWAISLAVIATVALGGSVAQAAAANVLLVCPQPGSSASCPSTAHSSIQAAVNDATQAGDWVLVAPGDYHEQGVAGASEPAGVLIQTPWTHLRGMNRNTVVVDGTKPGSSGPCRSEAAAQDFTARNGIEVYKADGVYVQNLTTCNFLTGPNGGEGNEIWWNGGDGSGQIGMGPWWGSYLTATSTYSNGVDPPFGDYGIFISNADGPGSVTNSYASNMGDAGFYVGACPDCNAVLDHIHTQDSSLGFSGTNAGGHLLIENSEFDHNKTGPTQDSENNDDAPPPQNGQCPGGAPGPLGTGICDIWRNNYIHDNNNPNVPGNSANGLAGAAPVGGGVVFAGTEYIELYKNRIEHNGSWGALIVDQPYMGSQNANCQGGTYVPGQLCYFQAFGNEVVANSFRANGGFGNPTNGDIGLITTPHDPGNCFHDNTDPAGLTSDPPNIQSSPFNPCGQPNGSSDPVLTAQVLCATQLVAPCPGLPGANYPRPTTVTLRMPPPQPTMPNPCQGVPDDPWCQNGKPTSIAPR
jgi:hypothetical protein